MGERKEERKEKAEEERKQKDSMTYATLSLLALDPAMGQ